MKYLHRNQEISAFNMTYDGSRKTEFQFHLHNQFLRSDGFTAQRDVPTQHVQIKRIEDHKYYLQKNV